MNTLIAYLVSTTFALGIFYGAYMLFLRSETYFRLNRFYLQLSLLISLVFPLSIFIGQKTALFPILLPAENILQTITLDTVKIGGTTEKYPGLFGIIGYIYIAVMILLFARLIYRFYILARLKHKAEKSVINNKPIYWINAEITPFSFFNTIYIPENLRGSHNLKNIISHEQVHIKKLHSLDIFITQVLRIFFWINPFIVLTERALREIHEFEADKEIVNSVSDPVAYTMLLLQQNKSTQPLIFVNNFNYSLIKRRLIMFNKKSNRYARLKVFAILPIALLIVSFYTTACNQPDPKQEIVVSKSIEDSTPVINADEPDTVVFTVVEKMPKFPGGEKARIEYLLNNIKYPDEAKKKGVQGTVYITFVVEADGSITNPKVLRGFDKLCDEEAYRVIKAMPKWEPGSQKGKLVRVQFNLPIKFTLGD